MRPPHISKSNTPVSTCLPAALAALAVGLAAATMYYEQGLTLAHYDAKAHLVVARRIIDSLQPGWMQIGAVWLPFPHLLNVLPVQNDWLYQTGLSGVMISLIGFVIGATSLWYLVARATGSAMAAWTGFAVFAAQPDVLYLQATPMTEALAMGLTLLGVALAWQWVADDATDKAWPAGVALALACLTRYEAWLVTSATFVLAYVALVRRCMAWRQAVRRVARLAAFPSLAIIAFLVLSRVTVGAWLVTGGFFEIEPSTYHRPLAALGAVFYGTRLLNGSLVVTLAAIALGVVAVSVACDRDRGPLLVTLSLVAYAALPLYGFWRGHPFRIRYMVLSTMPLAAMSGLGVGLLPVCQRLAATLVIATALIEAPPLSSRSPMVLEAGWDRPRSVERQRVTRCLTRDYDGTLILASMKSLAHFMQETSRAGFSIRQYIHEGLGRLWTDSLVSARRHAGWVLIEEQAEGGDDLARLEASSPAFLIGFERVCEGGGVTLYRRLPGSSEPGE